MGKVAWRSHDERGTVKAAKQFYYSPSDNPPYGVLPAPSTGRLLVRFISLHIKPALKGEVANVVSRRGYKAAYSSLFITTPQLIRLAAYCQPKNPLAISKRFLSAFIPKTDEKSAIMLEQSENMNLAERSL